ncbi:MAG TPA: hypothetical protein VJ697_13785 [Nitrososphaeraceae archaeon]|nr:hypothetical protein [Nitrososphaeraceae archaeon]
MQVEISYKKSTECWFELIQPFKSKMNIAMGDHNIVILEVEQLVLLINI